MHCVGISSIKCFICFWFLMSTPFSGSWLHTFCAPAALQLRAKPVLSCLPKHSEESKGVCVEEWDLQEKPFRSRFFSSVSRQPSLKRVHILFSSLFPLWLLLCLCLNFKETEKCSMNAVKEGFICFCRRFLPCDSSQLINNKPMNNCNSCRPSVFLLCKVHGSELVIFDPKCISFA